MALSTMICRTCQDGKPTTEFYLIRRTNKMEGVNRGE